MAIIAIVAALGLVVVTFAEVPQVEAVIHGGWGAGQPNGPPVDRPQKCTDSPSPYLHDNCGGYPFQ